MAETMIERVARALCESQETTEENWQSWVHAARAVIREMREPTNTMTDAGFDAESTANPHKTQPHHVVPAVWSAMIDAALKD